MIVTVTPRSELVDLEIEGHGKAERITWPEAMEQLDRAYTEDIAATTALLDTYIKAAQAGIIQAANALEALKELKKRQEERHRIAPGREEDSEAGEGQGDRSKRMVGPV